MRIRGGRPEGLRYVRQSRCSPSLAASLAIATLLLTAGCRTLPPKSAPDTAVRVADVRLIGFEVLPADALERLRDEMPLKTGAVFTDAVEQSAGTLAVETLQEQGRPYAEAQIAREPVGPNSIRVVITALAGPIGFFGPTEISGNVHTDDAIIRSRLTYQPGELFRRSALQHSQEQLAALQLFKSVRLEAQRVNSQPANVPIVVTVVEQSPWRWNLGLGYANKERLGLEGRLANMNFFGGARRLEIDGRISKIDHLIEASVIEPRIRTTRLTMALTARDWSIDDPAFTVVSRGGQAAFTWIQTAQSSTTFSYAISHERGQLATNDSPLVTGLQEGLLSAWAVHLDHRPSATSSSLPSGPAWMVHLEQARS